MIKADLCLGELERAPKGRVRWVWPQEKVNQAVAQVFLDVSVLFLALPCVQHALMSVSETFVLGYWEILSSSTCLVCVKLTWGIFFSGMCV